jgi:hypothetical protein
MSELKLRPTKIPTESGHVGQTALREGRVTGPQREK